ncbi:MAG: neutral/alkaline non-lysosomal ceramidase N-terminal domain-containing protein [Anaerolineae bacterium]|nr:neutral/alkaline non-lysosomal ceramidase N-terminal domain-containing protein [Anaerolineae bacterium]MDW8071675.1 neutral/alkaline non-lysosomal ceramidase N-terminal domain-containing protein [Anaerolineae bacterium]
MNGEIGFRAGAAKVDITPPVGCWLEGIPRDQPSNAIHDPLYARALVIEHGSERICLVTCDLIGMTVTYARDVRMRIAEVIGSTFERVVVACSHTHSGPTMLGSFDPVDRVDRQYLRDLAERLVRVSREAAGQLQPAQLGVGRGAETTISQYRRLWTRDGRIVMNWEEFPADQIVGPAEEGDPEVGVVRIDALDGDTIAVLFNYACHPNSLPGDNFTITADFPGYAAEIIERSLGGVALFTNGALGSVDIEGFVDRDFVGVERRGRALGTAVLQVCTGIREMERQPIIRSARHTFLMPYRKVAPELVAWAEEVVARGPRQAMTLRDGISDEIKAEFILKHVNRREPGAEFELVGLRLGKAVFVAIPGEPFTEIGRRMKTLAPELQLHIIALANGYLGYIATAKASAEGGYATDVASGAPFVEHAEDLIYENTHILLTQLR